MINMPAGPEIMVILLLALLVLGPDQLPKAMRSFGNVMSEIRKVSSSFQEEMRDALEVMEAGVKPSEESMKIDDGSASTVGSVDKPKTGNDPDVDTAERGSGTGASGTTSTTDTTAGTTTGPDDDDGPPPPPIDPADRAAG